MKTLNNSLLGGIALAMLSSVSAIAAPTAAPKTASPKIGPTPAAVTNVLVTNTTAQPVPTVATGTTTVAGTVAATQSGPWNVGISGTAVVKIVQPVTSPIPVAVINEGARIPFQKQVHISTDITGSGSAVISVPAGWRLVIEHINGFAYVGQKDDIIDYQVGVTYGGEGASYEFHPVVLSDVDHYHTFVNESFLAYADPGSLVGVFIETASSGAGTPTADGYVRISGHLEK